MILCVLVFIFFSEFIFISVGLSSSEIGSKGIGALANVRLMRFSLVFVIELYLKSIAILFHLLL